MDDKILERLRDAVNDHTSHFSAEIPAEKKPYVSFAGDNLVTSFSRILRIKALDPFSDYRAGQTWNIYETEISDAIFHRTQKDPEFKSRISRGVITASDVMFIIRRASKQLLNLTLICSPSTIV